MKHKPLQKIGHGAVRATMKKTPMIVMARDACRDSGMGYAEIDDRYVVVDKTYYDLKLR